MSEDTVQRLDDDTSDIGSPAATYPDVATLKLVCPGSPEANLRKYAPFLLNAMGKYGLTS